MSLVDLTPGENAQRVHDHWWWRPGWRVGRRFYTFHITFENQQALFRLAAEYRRCLSGLPGLTLVPDRWLHLTMQGIDFTDQVPTETVARIAEQTRVLLADRQPFNVEFAEIVVADEAIALPAQPADPIRELRATTRAAIGHMLGEDQVPEHADRFRPHVSLAYLTADGSAQPYIDALHAVRPEPAQVRVERVDLIELNRDRHMYEWTVVAPIPIGAG